MGDTMTRLFLTFMFLALNVSSAAASALGSSQSKTTIILTSFPILQDVVKALAPQGAVVECLVPRDGDIHSYKPTAQDVLRLEKAHLVLLWGLELDENVQRLTQTKSLQSRTHVVTDRISKPSSNPTAPHADPHLWQSPRKMKEVVLQIERILKTSDPSQAAVIEKRSLKFQKNLEKIARHYQKKFSRLKTSQKKLVTPHQAFDYLAQEMGLESVALLGADPDQSPSLKSLQAVIQRLKREKTPVLFRESSLESSWLENVARETGAQIRGPLYADGLTLEPPAHAYPQVLEYNLETIWTALQEVPK
ncbi:MAG: metal ABC transporter substrate-binding protein [Bdellovibrionales bacterium]